MSGPYVYRPPTTPTSYSSGAPFQQTPYYVNTPRASTPFIPDRSLYPPSPYSRSNPASPNRGNVGLPRSPADLGPERYEFPRPIGGSAYNAGYDGWDREPVPLRERRPSWHGPNESPWPGVAPTPQSTPAYGPGGFGNGSAASVAAGAARYQRRHSFNASSYPIQVPQIQLNPFLNAEMPNPDFFFDLAVPFEPLIAYGRGETPVVLPREDLAQPATNPLITRMRITCDELPAEWVVDIDLPLEQQEYFMRNGYELPPITVLDVLAAVHRVLHKPISHRDFGHLSQSTNTEVSNAYWRRCKAAARSQQEYEREQSNGIKRVDYLRGKTRFMGLLITGKRSEEGLELMKLITTDVRRA